MEISERIITYGTPQVLILSMLIFWVIFFWRRHEK